MARSEYWEHENETGDRLGCNAWCAPLHLVEQVVAGTVLGDRFEVDDFMIGPRLVRAGRPALHLYKHGETRKYLNVDTRGAVYHYLPAREDGLSDGRYVKYKTLDLAIRNLDLHLLPPNRVYDIRAASRRRRGRPQSA